MMIRWSRISPFFRGVVIILVGAQDGTDSGLGDLGIRVDIRDAVVLSAVQMLDGEVLLEFVELALPTRRGRSAARLCFEKLCRGCRDWR